MSFRPPKLGHYILMGKLAVPEPNWFKWAMWFGTSDRQIAFTVIGPIKISTIFMGVGNCMFETMIFRGGEGDEQYRYSSWEEAEAGHARAVAQVRAEIIEKVQEE